MIKFKIWGERNSGTNYLEKIIGHNFGNIFVHDIIDNVYYYWKHGIPHNSIKNYFNEETIVDIFIFRNLDEWLLSMYNNQYNLKYIDKYDEFLTCKQSITENKYLDFITNKPINYDDNEKTIFEIRYHKYKHIIDYYNNNNNVILVNLSYLQENNENVLVFLTNINNKYNLNKSEYTTDFIHTKKLFDKSITNEKKRTYIQPIDMCLYNKIIDLNKNNDVEKFIDNLQFIIKK